MALSRIRTFSTSISRKAGVTTATTARAIVFASHGNPTEVLKCHTFTLPAVKTGEARVEFQLTAINPADINVIQGVYPSKPALRYDIGSKEPLVIMGNEATGIVRGFEDEDGKIEHSLKIGDVVIMGKNQLGTWTTQANLPLSFLIPLHCKPPLTPAQASTLSINPPTALRMLSDFVPLSPTNPLNQNQNDKKKEKQQWVIQNGGNSAVGIAVIQIAKSWGVKTINLVRDRDDIESLKSDLKVLGADYVLTYSEFLKRETRTEIKEWIRDGEMKLALNCVGGKETTEMAKLLSLDGFLVTYGGMAKQSLSIPPSLFIFKKLTSTGFWLSNWCDNNPIERKLMIEELAQLTADGRLKEADNEIVELDTSNSDEAIGIVIREVMQRIEAGRSKKILLKWI